MLRPETDGTVIAVAALDKGENLPGAMATGKTIIPRTVEILAVLILASRVVQENSSVSRAWRISPARWEAGSSASL